MSHLQILIADDHEVVRRGLRLLLESQPGWEVCDEAVDGREAVAKALKLKPDVAILDMSMPELNGLETTRQILKGLPKTEVLMLTMYDTEEMAREVVEAGARGYVLKSDASQELITAVASLARHKPYFTTRVAQMVVDGFLGRATVPNRGGLPGMRLTAREREIVQLVAEGKSSKEVATALGISVKTAETHRTNLMRKLDLHSTSELVRYAIRNKIVEA